LTRAASSTDGGGGRTVGVVGVVDKHKRRLPLTNRACEAISSSSVAPWELILSVRQWPGCVDGPPAAGDCRSRVDAIHLARRKRKLQRFSWDFLGLFPANSGKGSLEVRVLTVGRTVVMFPSGIYQIGPAAPNSPATGGVSTLSISLWGEYTSRRTCLDASGPWKQPDTRIPKTPETRPSHLDVAMDGLCR
jgi:hypothetical protein